MTTSMKLQLSRVIKATCLLWVAACMGVPAHAAPFPTKPITFVVPFGAGSATDLLARALSVSVAAQTGQPVIVENRGGASGMIAAQHVARATPDGYTVLITTNTTQAANPHFFKSLPYDPIKDFTPLTSLGRGGMVLVVRADSPYRTVEDLIRVAKKDPGKLTFGSGNSSSRMAAELFKQLSGTDISWVGYNSNPAALNDLLGGHIDMMVIDTVTGLPQIQAGKLHPLGASTATRLIQLPEVPTLEQAGIRGYDIGYWFAAYLPAHAPADVAQQLRDLLVSASKSPQAGTFFKQSATEAWTSTSAELDTFQTEQYKMWGRVINAAGIRPE